MVADYLAFEDTQKRMSVLDEKEHILSIESHHSLSVGHHRSIIVHPQYLVDFEVFKKRLYTF